MDVTPGRWLDSDPGEVVVELTESVQENAVNPDCDFRTNVRLQDTRSTAC